MLLETSENLLAGIDTTSASSSFCKLEKTSISKCNEELETEIKLMEVAFNKDTNDDTLETNKDVDIEVLKEVSNCKPSEKTHKKEENISNGA